MDGAQEQAQFPKLPGCGEWAIYDSVSTGDVQINDKITISKNFKENVIRPILKVRGLCPCLGLGLWGSSLPS